MIIWGSGPQPVAENIEDLRFRYVTEYRRSPGRESRIDRLDDIRMIQVTIVARTDKSDPQLAKVGDGFRRRTLTSNIQLRNLLFL